MITPCDIQHNGQAITLTHWYVSTPESLDLPNDSLVKSVQGEAKGYQCQTGKRRI